MSDTDLIFDSQEQIDEVRPWLLDGETLRAVYDCKGVTTGFMAITDCRVMFYDGLREMDSIPFDRITVVTGSESEFGLLGSTSKLGVQVASGQFTFEFRGGDKAQQACRLIMTKLLRPGPA